MRAFTRDHICSESFSKRGRRRRRRQRIRALGVLSGVNGTRQASESRTTPWPGTIMNWAVRPHCVAVDSLGRETRSRHVSPRGRAGREADAGSGVDMRRKS
jgi:hypothetical protein